MLTGRDGQKFLEFVNENPNLVIEFRDTLDSLYQLSQWASVEKYSQLAQNKASVPTRLARLIITFSDSWRADNLPAINKIHIIEAHLADCIIRHGGWGVFGEQGSLILEWHVNQYF